MHFSVIFQFFPLDYESVFRMRIRIPDADPYSGCGSVFRMQIPRREDECGSGSSTVNSIPQDSGTTTHQHHYPSPFPHQEAAHPAHTKYTAV